MEPNLMHSLDNGMSILKRGMVTIPVSIHRTTAWYSLLSNWNHPSKLPYYQSQSSVDLSSWMLKGYILTSGLNSERKKTFSHLPPPQNWATFGFLASGVSQVSESFICYVVIPITNLNQPY